VKDIIRIGNTYVDLRSVTAVEYDPGEPQSKVEIYLLQCIIGLYAEQAKEFMDIYEEWVNFKNREVTPKSNN